MSWITGEREHVRRWTSAPAYLPPRNATESASPYPLSSTGARKDDTLSYGLADAIADFVADPRFVVGVMVGAFFTVGAAFIVAFAV